MSKGKHTHRGHCQRCGAVQAASNAGDRRLAKHGYVVAGFGFFNGVCRGSDRAPLELERTYLDETVNDLAEYAAQCTAAAEAMKAGTRHPVMVESGEYKKNPATYRREPVMIAWEDANDVQRERGIKAAIWRQEQEARHAAGHAEMLTKLAASVHGQPLQAVEHKALAPIVIGSTFQRYGINWTVRREWGRGKYTCVYVQSDGSERKANFMSRQIRAAQGVG